MLRHAVPIILLCGLPGLAAARTVTKFSAPTGSVSSTLAIVMNLSGGGTASFTPAVGPNCSLGQTCGYSNTAMNIALPDGSSVSLANLHGTFQPLSGNTYEVLGRGTGTTSAGGKAAVSALQVTMSITCNRGCSKTYLAGKFRLTTP
jgi:hypothetical protein